LAEHEGRTLVEFRPETGRTHQIRVHAASGLGSPLLGDPVYGDGNGAPRTMLHAAQLSVPREGKPTITATAPFPADFSAAGFASPMAETVAAPEQPEPLANAVPLAGNDEGN
jgi:tRNA pseudouridine32 synthase/23S rRNA pseudouridine746 synthase